MVSRCLLFRGFTVFTVINFFLGGGVWGLFLNIAIFPISFLFLFVEDESIDGDSPEHIKWIYDRALERAQEYNISGVTYQLTQGKSFLKVFFFFKCILGLCCNYISGLSKEASFDKTHTYLHVEWCSLCFFWMMILVFICKHFSSGIFH